MTFRAIFFGSPAFAVPSLDALHGIAEVTAVVCQPDKPAGRGLALAAPAVKTHALDLGLRVVQPTKLQTGDFATWVRAQNADVALVVAYGRILPADVLAATRLGFVNVHASLLPRYRGAAPITWSIVHGDTETGVTLMKLDEGMDTGPTFARVVTPIDADETAADLSARLAALGAEAVREWLPAYVAGTCTLVPQDGAAGTLAPILDKEHGRIDWSKRAREVHDHVRGMFPWPGAFTSLHGRRLQVRATRVVHGTSSAEAPIGSVVLADKSRVLVACGDGGLVELMNVQPDGRRPMAAAEWVIGRGVAQGDMFGA